MEELVYLKRQEAVCDSLLVAEKFGKRHDSVLRNIETILKNTTSENTKLWFQKMEYKTENNNKSYHKYLMNRKGFSLLAMGFTGIKAQEWKEKYIEAFEQMESFIREKQSTAWIESRQQSKASRKLETDAIKEFVQYAKDHGSHHADLYYMNYSKMVNNAAGIKDREMATANDLTAVSMMEIIVSNCIKQGMEEDKPYKEIYQFCKERLDMFSDIACLKAGRR